MDIYLRGFLLMLKAIRNISGPLLAAAAGCGVAAYAVRGGNLSGQARAGDRRFSPGGFVDLTARLRVRAARRRARQQCSVENRAAGGRHRQHLDLVAHAAPDG